ncbi:MAG: hypothetical protein IJP01_02055 [Oscillospiraceae bacterium]|nr:hypothetical protein [Oscillospiraceae bacterium]
MKPKLWIWFAAAAVLLFGAMCAAVAYSYCELLWCGRYGLCSAPASTAFLLALPFWAGILLCAVPAICLYRRFK